MQGPAKCQLRRHAASDMPGRKSRASATAAHVPGRDPHGRQSWFAQSVPTEPEHLARIGARGWVGSARPDRRVSVCRSASQPGRRPAAKGGCCGPVPRRRCRDTGGAARRARPDDHSTPRLAPTTRRWRRGCGRVPPHPVRGGRHDTRRRAERSPSRPSLAGCGMMLPGRPRRTDDPDRCLSMPGRVPVRAPGRSARAPAQVPAGTIPRSPPVGQRVGGRRDPLQPPRIATSQPYRPAARSVARSGLEGHALACCTAPPLRTWRPKTRNPAAAGFVVGAKDYSSGAWPVRGPPFPGQAAPVCPVPAAARCPPVRRRIPR